MPTVELDRQDGLAVLTLSHLECRDAITAGIAGAQGAQIWSPRRSSLVPRIVR